MISIIIPVYNQHKLTVECLEAISRHTFGEYELIIVDNGSVPSLIPCADDGHWKRCPIVIRNEHNAGFPAAVNQGITAAKGDIIVLLNNDVVVTPGWLERLQEGIDRFDIVAPVTNYSAGLQRVLTDTYEDNIGLDAVAVEWTKRYSKERQEVSFVIGFCMAFRKSLWEKIGPFDESLWPSSGEEIDFCFRARAAGRRVAIVRDCYVHHYGSQTFTAMQQAGEADYDEVCKKAEANIAAKWGKGFWSRQEVTA